MDIKKDPKGAETSGMDMGVKKTPSPLQKMSSNPKPMRTGIGISSHQKAPSRQARYKAKITMPTQTTK
jgi:hypothetical protein